MTTVSIYLSWDTIDQAIGRLDEIERNAKTEIINITKAFAGTLQNRWQDVTPKRSNRLSQGNKAVPEEMSINLMNGVYYYDWVNDGHNTPKEWHKYGRIIYAKRITHVSGRQMTQKITQYAADTLADAYVHFLDKV